MVTQNYPEVMENLYIEYEKSCLLLEKRIDELLKERSRHGAKSREYIELYNRIRRLERCLEETRSWQGMVKNYLLIGGMSDEEIALLVDKQD